MLLGFELEQERTQKRIDAWLIKKGKKLAKDGDGQARRALGIKG